MNKLADESSPYLLQHARNPVDWYPWGEEALKKAQEEDKMLIISVGYAACHWCHVMEHESFEDSTVAEIMNEHFVSVKVDREERPDIDNIYMTACQLSSQRGCGWPLNAFALPDGRPVWAGTYFPKENWINILENFIKEKNENPEKLEDYADQLTQGIKASEDIIKSEYDETYTEDQISKWASEFLSIMDMQKGGRKGAPKFPMPGMYEFLLHYYFLSGDTKALDATRITLDRMAMGGIYDQVGGAFARYSVDADWKVPHFEKMLYDNAQLLSLYAQAYKITKNPEYAKTIRETTDFLKREWTSKDNGFYSSYDADSEGEEGTYYVWSMEEIRTHVDEKIVDAFIDYYNISNAGNWEGSNILFSDQKIESIAKKHGHDTEELKQAFNSTLLELRQIRNKREKPGLDDKILTSWNALMISGLLDAYSALGEQDYLQMALKNASFLKRHALKDDGGLYRNHKDGKSSINAFLDDYALVIKAWIDMYNATLDEDWLFQANDLLSYVDTHFTDSSSGMYYYNSKLDPELIVRKKEVTDNVIPASNSVMAHNLLKLGIYLDNKEYKARSEQMMQNMLPQINSRNQSHFFYNWCNLYLDLLHSPFEVAIVGNDYKELLGEMQRSYNPDVLFLGGSEEGSLALLEEKKVEGETTVYVCENKVCQLPVKTVDKARKQLSEARKKRQL